MLGLSGLTFFFIFGWAGKQWERNKACDPREGIQPPVHLLWCCGGYESRVPPLPKPNNSGPKFLVVCFHRHRKLQRNTSQEAKHKTWIIWKIWRNGHGPYVAGNDSMFKSKVIDGPSSKFLACKFNFFFHSAFFGMKLNWNGLESKGFAKLKCKLYFKIIMPENVNRCHGNNRAFLRNSPSTSMLCLHWPAFNKVENESLQHRQRSRRKEMMYKAVPSIESLTQNALVKPTRQGNIRLT